ncbi:MAG: T9SS type A sorting domain-containing protein [Flavobacteriales bacterium]|nr:T9SS type A sorting domain-containing protein [Flavobacteriales bacterium]
MPNQFISSGGAVTIQQLTTFTNFIPRQGFELNWSCTTVGIEENSVSESDFIVYPNPTSSVINIKSETNFKINEVQLISLVGKIIYQSGVKDNSKDITIDIANFSKGVYILSVLTEKGVVNKRVIVQ